MKATSEQKEHKAITVNSKEGERVPSTTTIAVCRDSVGRTLKQPIFGVFKRNGRVYTEIIPDCKKKTLLPIIQGKGDVKSVMYTDGWKAYDGLVSIGCDKHLRVNHSANEFALKGQNGAMVTVNGIESFWSFTKRRLAKFNGYTKYSELYLKECEWRWKKIELDLETELWDILNEYLRQQKKIEIKS